MTGFTNFRVEADYVKPTSMAIGVGSICADLPSALAERDRLRADPKYCNVRIERRDYGRPQRKATRDLY